MAKQLLDDTEVRATVEQVRGEGVAQGVWRGPIRQIRTLDETIDAHAQASAAQGLAPRAEEEGVGGRDRGDPDFGWDGATRRRRFAVPPREAAGGKSG